MNCGELGDGRVKMERWNQSHFCTFISRIVNRVEKRKHRRGLGIRVLHTHKTGPEGLNRAYFVAEVVKVLDKNGLEVLDNGLLNPG